MNPKDFFAELKVRLDQWGERAWLAMNGFSLSEARPYAGHGGESAEF